MHPINDLFFDIRPYHDDEVPAALERLLNDNEFVVAILNHRIPQLSGISWALLPFLKQYLRIKWRKIKTVRDVQLHVSKYLRAMMDKTSDGLTTSGLDKLDPKESYLFISNHRDIALDPALINLCLFQHNFDTVRIAIGDNLLKKPCVTELMKMNKSFVVKRSVKAPREMIHAFGQLSAYIKTSLDEKQSIWIAQKEGRAKDGDDKTEPAILKMFYMHGRAEKIPFNDYITSLRIVPISISYENDPCDLAKANELYRMETEGHYQKSEFEDIDTIVQGIFGNKRRINVAFGDVIQSGFDSPENLAKEIDRQIYNNYHFFPANYIAAEKDHSSINEQEQQLFQQKLAGLPDGVAKYIKTMYAMPVHKKTALEKNV